MYLLFISFNSMNAQFCHAIFTMPFFFFFLKLAFCSSAKLKCKRAQGKIAGVSARKKSVLLQHPLLLGCCQEVMLIK